MADIIEITYNNELVDLASKIEKLKYEIIHGYYTTEEEIIKTIYEKINELGKQIQVLINDKTCNQVCLMNLTDEEKKNLSKTVGPHPIIKSVKEVY
jgi:hypothetical protein